MLLERVPVAMAHYCRICDRQRAEVARLARVVREMAEIRPHKRKRLRFLAKEHQDLFERLRELELLDITEPY